MEELAIMIVDKKGLVNRLLNQAGKAILIFYFLSLVLLPQQARAQSDSGRVVGNVTDTTGAAIPGATLKLTNTANGTVRTVTSNGAGELSISAVPPGDYSAKIEAPGFQSQAQNFSVVVTQVQTLNFKLSPGSVSTTIDVTTAAAPVNTTDATLGETIESKQITELPLNGRNALTLALLTPGVTQGVYGENSQDTINRYGDSGGGALSVNGIRPQANNFILDGVDNNDGLQNIIVFFPAVEATEEFKVNTNVAPAQFGRAGGALVVSSTKPGTNQIHGAIFQDYRSAKFDSNPNYRVLDAPATKTPPFNRNQFGAAAGMPIIKDKLFIFGDYQALRAKSPGASAYASVPTLKMRTGDFSELLDPTQNASGFVTTFPKCVMNSSQLTSKGQIYDPQTCQPFAGNIIPQGRLNPAAVNYLNAFPKPSRDDRDQQNYFYQQQANQKFNTFDVRLDWTVSPKDLLFFRSSYDNSTSTSTSKLGPTLPHDAGSNYTHARGYVLGSTHTFSANIVNEARLAYNRDNYGYQPPNYGQNISADLGIVNANRNLETSGGALIGGSNGQLEYSGDYGLFAVPQNTYELTDTLNWQRGRHTIKLGGTFLRRQVNFFRPISGKGFFAIASNGNDFTGFEDTELLVGGVDNYAIGAQNGFFGNMSQEDGIFAQDDFRVNRRLTLNLGVRWDLLTWPYEMHDRQSAINVNDGTMMIAGQNGVSRSIIHQDYTNFAPRVGFAYDLTGDGKTAVHGGYGIFYFPDYGGISNQLGQQAPYGGSATYYAKNGYCVTFTGQTSALGAPYSCAGYTTPAAVTTALPAPGFPGFKANALPQGLGGIAVDPNSKHSRIQQWNLQVERQLTQRDTLSVAYVGTHADRLSTYYPYNTYAFGSTSLPFPNLGGISYNVYRGISNYNGMQTHFEHKTANAVLTASYAWSHTLDNSPDAFGGSTVSLFSQPFANYGNSSQDERHIFSFSGVYTLPFGRGQKFGNNISRPLDMVIGGWQTNLIALVATGQPVDLSTGTNNPGNTPDLIGSIKYPKGISGHWFDPTSFSRDIPTVTAPNGDVVYTRLGTLGRNQIYGPGSRVVNMTVQKSLHFTESIALQLHGDAFNLLNTPQFTNPGSSMSNPGTFGVITGVKGSSNRQIQIGSRLSF